MTTPATSFDALTPTAEMPLIIVNDDIRGTHAGCTFEKNAHETHVHVTRDTRLVILADTPRESRFHFHIGRDASLKMTHVALVNGGAHRVTFDLDDVGASVECATFVATTADTMMYEFTTHHRAARTRSFELARCIASGHGRIEWFGHVNVDREAPDCYVRQDNKNLLLTDTATIIAKPELDIEIDAVEASHGSATGSIDEEAMLYLGTRGITPAEAKHLLTLAFADAVFEKLPPNMRELVIEQFSEKMDLV